MESLADREREKTSSGPHGCVRITPEIRHHVDTGDRPRGGRPWLPFRFFFSSPCRKTRSRRITNACTRPTCHGPEVLQGTVEIGEAFQTRAAVPRRSLQDSTRKRPRLLTKGTIVTSWTISLRQHPIPRMDHRIRRNSLTRTRSSMSRRNRRGGHAIWMSAAARRRSAGNICLLPANGAFETVRDANGFRSMGISENSFLEGGQMDGRRPGGCTITLTSVEVAE